MSDDAKVPLNINEILGLINVANKQLEHDVYIPSLNKEIHLKPLNAMHTKNIAKSAIEGQFAQNMFTTMIYHILKDVSDPSIPLTHINILDKLIIMLELRAKNIKPQLMVKCESIDGKTSDVKVDLISLFKKVKKLKLSFDDEVVELDNYKITLNYPSIEEEYQFENNLYKTRIANIDQKNEKAIKDLAMPMMINWISQYIKKIQIGEQEIDLVGRKISDRTDIFETLSAKAFKEIVDKIDNSFAKQLSKITGVSEVIDEIEYTGTIEITPALFLVS